MAVAQLNATLAQQVATIARRFATNTQKDETILTLRLQVYELNKKCEKLQLDLNPKPPGPTSQSDPLHIAKQLSDNHE